MEKIFLISLGCDKNLVDSEVMLGILTKAGYAVTSDEYEADAVIVNTCGFIAEAAQEGIDSILAMARLKESGACRALIVTGCMVQRYKDEVLNEMPEIDAIVGADGYGDIVSVLEGVLNKTPRGERQNRPVSDTDLENRILTGPSYYAYLKIAEGCSNRCSYCTIWKIRGDYKSRTVESLVNEAGVLAKNGVRELILVAQDTAQYGIDLYASPCLERLISELSKITGIEWIRILYAYPEHITDGLINEMALNSKCCHYLDMPVQHADASVLKAMGRQSTPENLRALIKKLRAAMPDIALRTTVISGFPGEGEAEFQNLTDFISEVRFDSLGVFEYSREEGTKASKMPRQVRKNVKRARRDALMNTQKAISAEKLKAKIGQTVKVITDGRVDNSYCGRSYMMSYGIDGMIFFDADYEIISGEFVDVKITSSSEYDLYGTLNGADGEE